MVKSDIKLDKNGRPITTRYPPELVMMSMVSMANGTEASKINANITSVLEGTGRFDPERYQMPDQTTHRQWRFGMAHVCQVHIGLELTKAANNKKQVLTGDGTPVSGKHVESFVITTDDVNIAMIPWVQVIHACTNAFMHEHTCMYTNTHRPVKHLNCPLRTQL